MAGRPSSITQGSRRTGREGGFRDGGFRFGPRRAVGGPPVGGFASPRRTRDFVGLRCVGAAAAFRDAVGAFGGRHLRIHGQRARPAPRGFLSFGPDACGRARTGPAGFSAYRLCAAAVRGRAVSRLPRRASRAETDSGGAAGAGSLRLGKTLPGTGARMDRGEAGGRGPLRERYQRAAFGRPTVAGGRSGGEFEPLAGRAVCRDGPAERSHRSDHGRSGGGPDPAQ